MMKTIGVCGHFAEKKPTASGQIIKTRIVTDELIAHLGADEVLKVDSCGGAKVVPRMLWQSLKLFKNCRNILIMPAYKGLRVFVPVYSFYNLFFSRELHYVVIGGWLDSFLEQHSWLARLLKTFRGIYVETASMKEKLERTGFANVMVMPNFKALSIVDQPIYTGGQPYKLCTFSRVMREKGIEEAVEAVKMVNRQYGKTVCRLDIYGQVDPLYQARFEELQKQFPAYVAYRGLIPFEKSTAVLKNYFALLFPTFYHGEGFAGTLIDAMAAGLPVIASNWNYNSEIVIPGKTGVLVDDCNADRLCEQLVKIFNAPETWLGMRKTAAEAAKCYTPQVAMAGLLENCERGEV